MFYAFIGAFCLLTFAQFYIVYQIEDAISCIYKLIARIDNDLIEEMLDRLTNFKEKI